MPCGQNLWRLGGHATELQVSLKSQPLLHLLPLQEPRGGKSLLSLITQGYLLAPFSPAEFRRTENKSFRLPTTWPQNMGFLNMLSCVRGFGAPSKLILETRPSPNCPYAAVCPPVHFLVSSPSVRVREQCGLQVSRSQRLHCHSCGGLPVS